ERDVSIDTGGNRIFRRVEDDIADVDVEKAEMCRGGEISTRQADADRQRRPVMSLGAIDREGARVARVGFRDLRVELEPGIEEGCDRSGAVETEVAETKAIGQRDVAERHLVLGIERQLDLMGVLVLFGINAKAGETVLRQRRV